MRRWMVMSLLLAVAAGSAWAAEQVARKAEQPQTGERLVAGKVTAVDPEAGALVMEAVVGKKTLTVGVAVEKDTQIVAPPGNSLNDIKVRDTVQMRYLRTEDRLIAKSIKVQAGGAKAGPAKKTAAKAPKKAEKQ